MIQLWAKIYKDNRLIKDTTLKINTSKLDYSLFFDYIAEMCHTLDVPTPLIIKDSIFNFAKFNFVKFKSTDFVERCDFDHLLVELIK